MSIGQYCNREVVIAPPKVSALGAAQLMSHYHVGGLALAERLDLERCRPEGMLTDRDIVRKIVANDAQGALLGSVCVDDLLVVLANYLREERERKEAT